VAHLIQIIGDNSCGVRSKSH